MRNSEEASGPFGYGEAPFASPYGAPGGASYSGRQPVAYGPAPIVQQSFETRTHSGGSAGFGPLFRELRRALGLTLPTAASFSGTRIETIVALESGDLLALPPWPETVRVVTQLTGLAQIDPRPVLQLMHQEMARARSTVEPAQEATQWASAPTAQGPVMGTPLPTMMQTWGEPTTPAPRPRYGDAQRSQRAPELREEEDGEGLLERASEAIRGAFAGLKAVTGTGRIIALSAILIAAGGTIAQGSAIKASFATLHTPISRLLRGAENYLIWRSAPVKDGLRWITVDDPRSRKGDKLRVNRPSA